MTTPARRALNRRNYFIQTTLNRALVEALAREDVYRETLDAIPEESDALKEALADALAAVLTSSRRTSE